MMGKNHEIVFIGSSSTGLKSLIRDGDYTIRDVFCLDARINEDLLGTSSEYGFSVKKIKSVNDLREIVRQYPETMPFFIYQMDMLVPQDLTESYGFYNVHRGSLYTNRGPNPDVWSILSGDNKSSLSLHRINEKIDSGILIDEYVILVNADDDLKSLRKKLEAGLPKLIGSLKEYLGGDRAGVVMSGGNYRPWIRESDFSIDICTDTIESISRKIRSQSQYNGAILMSCGRKHYVSGIAKVEKQEGASKCVLEESGDHIKVILDQNLVTLILNKSPKYLPPAVHPPSKRV